MRLGFGLGLMLAAKVSCAQPIMDTKAVPKLDPAGRTAYAEFLGTNLPRAFAIGGTSAFGWYGGTGTIEQARAKALSSCAKSAPDCLIYAENLDVVWPGRLTQTSPPPPALISTWNYAIVPDTNYFWRSPAQAAGVYVWAHGYNNMADSRGIQPQPHVRAFNNAGFDVVRFDREPNADGNRERAAGWLQDTLIELRRRGYKKIIAGGQSRGAWNSLQMLQHSGLADTVIAVSPAAHGSGGSTNLSAQYDDLRQLVADVPQSPARLVFVQFEADPFAGDLDRRRDLILRLKPVLGGVLILDRPPGFRGHIAGQNAAFATQYRDCILHIATDTPPPDHC